MALTLDGHYGRIRTLSTHKSEAVAPLLQATVVFAWYENQEAANRARTSGDVSPLEEQAFAFPVAADVDREAAFYHWATGVDGPYPGAAEV